MSEYFLLMHPNGMNLAWSDLDAMPEWERRTYLRMFEDWREEQDNNTGGGGQSGSKPARFTRGG